MFNERVDRILTEARGLCYHIWAVAQFEGKEQPYCKTCQKFEFELQHCEVNPRGQHPTTNWQDYGEVIEWAKSDKDRWNDFLIWYLNKGSVESPEMKLLLMLLMEEDFIHPAVLTNPQKGSHALAEFIQEEGKDENSKS